MMKSLCGCHSTKAVAVKWLQQGQINKASILLSAMLEVIKQMQEKSKPTRFDITEIIALDWDGGVEIAIESDVDIDVDGDVDDDAAAVDTHDYASFAPPIPQVSPRLWVVHVYFSFVLFAGSLGSWIRQNIFRLAFS